MKHLFLILALLVNYFLFGQQKHESIRVELKDSLEQIISSKTFTSWDEISADTTLSGKDFSVVIRDGSGKLIKPSLENKIIRSISQNHSKENILYAGIKGNKAGDGKVALSMDFGKSWTYINKGHPLSIAAEDVQTIVVSPYDDNLIYAGTWKNGLYKSSDGGTSFTKVENFPSPDIRSIIFHPQNNDYILVATTTHGIVTTVDNCKNWKYQETEYLEQNFKAIWKLVQSPYNANELFALSIRQGLHKSTDFGATWKKIIDGPQVLFYGLGFNSESEIWCSSTNFKSGDIYVSKDRGETFKNIENNENYIISNFIRITNNVEDNFYLGGEKGLYKLNNDQLTKVNQALPFPTISHLLNVNKKLLIATWGNGIITKD